MYKMKTPVIAALLAAASLQFPLAALAHAQPVSPPSLALQPVKQQAGGYAVRIGDVSVVSLSDGTLAMDLHALLNGMTPVNIDRLLDRSFQRNPVETSINVYLVTLPGHRILVDTGSGQLFGPTTGGRLLESLAAQGLRPEDVTDVLLTHIHSDHSGGLVKDGQRVFPNATIHVSKPEVDFFFSEANAKTSGYGQAYFDVARKTLQPYLDAGMVKTFDETQDILPGITATIHPGHTPGSAFYRLSSAGQSLTFVGDIVHAAAVQFPAPEVTIDFDQNQAQAAAVRKAQLAVFARDRTLIAVPHVPFPGIGYVRAAAEGGYDWVPVNYTNRESDQ